LRITRLLLPDACDAGKGVDSPLFYPAVTNLETTAIDSIVVLVFFVVVVVHYFTIIFIVVILDIEHRFVLPLPIFFPKFRPRSLIDRFSLGFTLSLRIFLLAFPFPGEIIPLLFTVILTGAGTGAETCLRRMIFVGLGRPFLRSRRGRGGGIILDKLRGRHGFLFFGFWVRLAVGKGSEMGFWTRMEEASASEMIFYKF
jgi:hypothetical protein